LPKVDYQTPSPDGSAFAGLLDIGTETPPPAPETPPRADDVRETKRPDARGENSPPRRTDTNDRPRDEATEAAPSRESQTGTTAANKADGGEAPPKSDDDGDAPAAANDDDAGTTPDGDADAAVSVAVAATDSQIQVVTPVAIALAADQANDPAPAGETAADAVTASASAARVTADATFSLSGAADKAVQAATAQSREADNAAAQAQAVLAAAAKPAASPHHKQAHKVDETSDTGDSDAVSGATDNGDGLTVPLEQELAKSVHEAKEAKARHPEHMANVHVEAKTAPDSTSTPSTNGTPPVQQTTAGVNVVAPAATGAVSGAHPSDVRAASQPASDGAVPIAGLAVEITTRAKEGKNRFEIRLDPPDLGRIDVRLDIDRQGNVTSRLLVERADTLDLLRRDFGNLERALNDAGLKTDSGSLQFAMRDQSFAGGGQQQHEFTRSARIVVPGETEPTPSALRYNLALRSGIDIRV